MPLMADQRAAFSPPMATVFAPLMALRRCVVGLVAEQASSAVRVHAVDADPTLVGNLRGMSNPLQFSMALKIGRIVDDIGAGRMVLTPENYEAHCDGLRPGVFAAIADGVPPSQPPMAPPTRAIGRTLTRRQVRAPSAIACQTPVPGC